MNDDRWNDIARVTGRVGIANLVHALDRAYETLGQEPYSELMRDLGALTNKARLLVAEREAQFQPMA